MIEGSYASQPSFASAICRGSGDRKLLVRCEGAATQPACGLARGTGFRAAARLPSARPLASGGQADTRRTRAAAPRAIDVFVRAGGRRRSSGQAARAFASGSLRIGASTTIAIYLLPEYLGKFHQQHPGIDLHPVSANTRDIADLMLGHKIEIALVEGPVEDVGLEFRWWQTDIMTVIAAPFHPFASENAPIDPARLSSEMLVIREPGSGSREIVQQTLSAHGIHPSRTLEVGSTEAIKQLAAAGLGISIVSTSAVRDQVALRRLKMIDIAGIRFERALWQLKVPGRLSIPAADVFNKIIMKNNPSANASNRPTRTTTKRVGGAIARLKRRRKSMPRRWR